MTRIAINGLGRIGRATLRLAMAEPEVTVVAVNDRADIRQLAYLLRHDSVYSEPEEPIRDAGEWLLWGERELPCLCEEDPAALPWREYQVDTVIEATGVFREREQAARHLEAGARRVLITAPAKDPDLTLCLGVNDGDFDPQRHHVISNASCTTNCLAPVARVLDEAFGIETGVVTTVHAVTGGQSLVDQPNRKFTRGRSALGNIVPTSTGAAEATGLVMPQLAGRMDGIAMRVPVIDGSIIDFVVQTREAVTPEAANNAFLAAAASELKGILGTTEDELVSSDIIGSGYSALVNLVSTNTVGNHTVRVLAWYDNEWGYAHRVVDVARQVLGTA